MKRTNLRIAREQKFPRQADFCEATGLAQSYVSDVERGLQRASDKFIAAACDALEGHKEEFFDQDGWALHVGRT